METSDILIIGAGAAGLMAAYVLSKKGKRVTVLEARGRTGGRIHTIKNESFFHCVELGAEFVHGNLPVTLGLLKEAGIDYSHTGGEMVRYKQGRFIEDEGFIENWGLLIDKLNKLKEDKSIGRFLDDEFGADEYKNLRDGVWRYVSGFDSADPCKASAFALRKEWQSEDEHDQHRINNGYCSMINYLAGKCRATGNNIYLNAIVKEIHWQKDKVKAITADGESYSAKQLLIALPLGILQADEGTTGAITIHPPITEQTDAVKKIGFGSVVKFLLQFDKPFWEQKSYEKLAGKSLKDMAFLLSDEEIPAWWTQLPHHSPVLTGWIGGPMAEAKKHCSNDELLQQGLQSLANIFKIPIDKLKDRLIAWNIINWTTESFTLGSYSYDMVDSPEARKVLIKGVDDTLFFAGEYLYEGPAMGTVEAALTSGKEVAKRMSDF